MVQSSKLNRATITSALVLALSGIAWAAAGTSAPAKPMDDPLKMIPADSLFCVRINNLNAALGQVDLFLVGLAPTGVSMPAKAMLGQLVGSPEPVGLNMSGDFVVFGSMPDSNNAEMSIAVLAPVSDYGQFATGNPNVKPANAQGISKISSQGESPMASVVQVGSYALASMADSNDAILALKKKLTGSTTGLTANLDPAELKRAGSAPVWAYLNVPVVAKKYGAVIKSGIETAKAMAGAMQGQQNPSGAAGAQMAMDIYGSMFDSLMNQARFVTLSLDPNASSMRATIAVAALPNTQMADTLKSSSVKLDPKMLGYTRNGSAFNLALSIDPAKWEKLNAMFLDVLAKSMAQNLSADDIAQIKKLTADSTGVMGGMIVGSIVIDAENKPPFNMRYVATLKDPAKFNQVLDEAVKMMNGGPLGKLYEKLGMKMTAALKRNAATYKDVSIDSMRLSVAMTDANSPAGQAVASMYGSGLNVQFATANGLLVYAAGVDPNATMREAIDQVKAGGPSGMPSETQAALQLIPTASQGSCFVTFNALRYLQMIAAVVPMPVPHTPMATQSNIALAGACGDGKATIEIALPKQHVTEIMGAVMQMQQQQMQQKQQQQETQPQAQPKQDGGTSTL
jgi:hypothetical protein